MKEVKQRRAARAMRRPNQGMTMLEIMIVLAIIGLVSAVVVVGIYPALKRARVRTAQMAVNRLAQMTVQYTAENREPPKGMDDLIPSYMKKKDKDPWNRDYVLHCPGQNTTDGCDAVSLGPDGQEGTADDIKSDL